MRALILVDLQNDFMPGGALGVPHADEILADINKLIPKFDIVLATLDWHPADHVSFASSHPGKKVGDVIPVKEIEQILWPVHCVRNTLGAELVRALDKNQIESLFYKGTDKEIDSYSAFFDNARGKSTGLDEFLTTREISELYIAGVATDYCVLYSVQDAISLGYDVVVVSDCCRGINLHPDDEKQAWKKMREIGASVMASKEIRNEGENA
ncbi:MAG TPA: bifunctional nicotinamidase/pyrazinamidase [Rhabdochlamydiaceae bacterium]|nr:bifunctional nicotinamidase/pyrazinamidase [Rhabdochlamydiaceae bacterium]